ncbi:adenylosuccinate synthase [Bdellovibrio svalbardensis]|uniref:Adenylosuccinate synthetase n=1 Tax=Bdellovibrio svalbardensis TaxID=2972972 RepID=A0ABT6DLU5_9BACT|nr:adenylosuccinate synthase [Bdellovibrio svalbardensis]MDG0817569.1 adenylosuccinate synthase [Bdellovibrio svalbardensis]
MSGVVVVGAQWGDEGKGKLIDVFAEKADMVVRYQGGANAGHTLVVNGQKTILHLVPSGILRAETTCVIASGVVIDVFAISKEIQGLKASGLLQNPKQLMISDTATVILPYHKALDAARESALSDEKIGTTGKGIGPAYEDRASRRAILFGDLFDRDSLRKKLELALREKNFILENYYKSTPFNIDEILKDLEAVTEELAPYRAKDCSLFISKNLKAGKRVLFEGAQGTMLDVLHGTYPFVTSSSTLSSNACASTGIGPMSVNKVIGVFKAYTTRVGSGPFPTELHDEVGEKIQADGHEFGSTTGRARRCGWLDLVALKYAIRVNGITNLAMMKIDVLTGHERLGVCTAYKLNGEIITELPTSPYELEKVEPIIEWLPGWNQDLTKVKTLSDLPRPTTNYIDYIGSQLGTPIDVISVGPGREQTLWVKPLFNN